MDHVVAGAGGVEIAVREFGGDGRPLLLLPGAGNTLCDLAPLASYLVSDHRVVGMDLRNHGRSGDGPWTWDAVLDDIHAVVEALDLTEPILVGHSLGGMVAAMYAQRIGGVAATVNLDGFGAGNPQHYDMDPGEAQRRLQLLRDATEQTISALTSRRTTSEIDTARTAWVDGALALDLDPQMAAEAFDRKLLDVGDGWFSIRPVASRLAELSAAIDALDVVALYRETSTPQLVYIATGEDPGLGDELRELVTAHVRGLIREFAEVTAANPSVQVIELDATHALIYECPELIAAQIREFTTTVRT